MSIIRVKDIVIHYELKGQGDPLMLLPGLGSDLSMWSSQIPYLAYDFFVVMHDPRGSGQTDAPDAPYTIGALAEDCFGLMDAIGIECAYLVGVSMGGMVAQEMAIRRPCRVKGLALGATSARVSPRHAFMLRSIIQASGSEEGRDLISRLELPWTLSDRFLQDERVAEAIATVRSRRRRAQPSHAMVRQASAMLEFDSRDDLSRIRAPTLVMTGRQDLLVPLGYAEELATGIEGCHLRVLEAAHDLVAEKPLAFSQELLAFLGQANHPAQ
jgi:3-oxoadipate enol-lactonase